MKKKHKIFAYCIIGTLAFASQTAVINAEETPIAGIDLVLHNFLQNDENDITNLENYLVNELANPYKDITFAKVSNYVNIRSTPDEEGEILGMLYNNSAAIIKDDVGKLYLKITPNDDNLDNYINQVAESDDIKKIIDDVNLRLAEALDKDNSLKEFIDYLNKTL